MRKPLPAPLPELVRPKTLDEFIGQSHIVGPDAPFRRLVEQGTIPSAIFWGPPGVGKTTLARILAKLARRHYFELSAVSAKVSDVRKVISYGGVLFLDEIHRFNKAQQDVLLPAVETGQVILLGATTENPAFSINSALLSRARVLEFHPLSPEEVEAGIRRAISLLKERYSLDVVMSDEVTKELAHRSGGDLRGALLVLEDMLGLAGEGPVLALDRELLNRALGRRALRYDRGGDEHYDHASAFQKSLRGSDPDAALYWMAKMIEGGEDPRFIARRLVVTAAEDVGLADPMALVLAESAYRAVEHIGMPEGRIILAEAVIYVATAPKSNSSKTSIDAALSTIRQGGAYPVPMHLRDAHYSSARSFGRGEGYVYPHTPGSPRIEYMPPELRGIRFYEPKSSWERSRIKTLERFLSVHHGGEITPEEKERVLELLDERGSLEIEEVAALLGISQERAKHILSVLHSEGAIRIRTLVAPPEGED